MQAEEWPVPQLELGELDRALATIDVRSRPSEHLVARSEGLEPPTLRFEA